VAIAQSVSVSKFEPKKRLENESTKALEFLIPVGVGRDFYVEKIFFNWVFSKLIEIDLE
jgi:hypothetical protein